MYHLCRNNRRPEGAFRTTATVVRPDRGALPADLVHTRGHRRSIFERLRRLSNIKREKGAVCSWRD